MKPLLRTISPHSCIRFSTLFLTAVTLMLVHSTTASAQQQTAPVDQPRQLHGPGSTISRIPSSPTTSVAPQQAPSSGLAILGGTHTNGVTEVPAQTSLTTLPCDCSHVIQLLMANKFRQNTFQNGSELAPGLMLGTPWQQTIGDLELLSVHCDGTLDPRNGPVFEVTLRNNSGETLEHVTVSAVAVLTQIHGQSPTTVVSITRIGASETLTVRIQLPASSMVMGPVGSPVQPFDTLVVAIDSFDELVENNELNNVSILRRGEIPMIPAAAITPAVPAVTPQLAVPSEPSSVPAIAAPEEAKPTSPLDAIDPDKLGEEMPMAN